MVWEKVTLGEVCRIEKGNIGILKATQGDYPLVVLGEERRTHNEYQFDGDAVVIPLVSSTGHGDRSMKRIHFQSGKFSVGSILCAVMPKDGSALSAEFLYRYLDLNKEQELVSRMKGMANVSLSIKSIAEVEIPLPPIQMQNKIVESFKYLETQTNSLSFEQSIQLDLLKKLRLQILQDAVQGKLVTEDPNDEPAIELLEQIKEGNDKQFKVKKFKKDKPLTNINQEEIKFEIPEKWVWCRMGEIADLNARIGWKGLSANEYKEKGPLFISVHALNYGDYVDYKQAFHITQERFDESPEIMLQNDDILICKDGAGIGKLGIIKDLKKEATVNSSLLIIRCNFFLNVKYIYYYLLSDHFQNIVNSRIMGATTPHLYQRDLVNFLVALPPRIEQNKIVTKVEKLMNVCDELEQSIRQNQKYTQELLQVALKEALEPK
jgi:type I restriction enzyme, S subunit